MTPKDRVSYFVASTPTGKALMVAEGPEVRCVLRWDSLPDLLSKLKVIK